MCSIFIYEGMRFSLTWFKIILAVVCKETSLGELSVNTKYLKLWSKGLNTNKQNSLKPQTKI